jgi:hypothetical protein
MEVSLADESVRFSYSAGMEEYDACWWRWVTRGTVTHRRAGGWACRATSQVG